MKLQMKRVYDAPAPDDGYRVLVDRLWPRGERKEDIPMDRWEKDVTPSPRLRTDFHKGAHDFREFSELYSKELDAKPEAQAFAQEVIGWLKEKNVTLLFAAKDVEHSHVHVLIDWLKKNMK